MKDVLCSWVMEMLVHVACCITIRPVRSQISGFGWEAGRSSLAERRRESHVLEASVVRVVLLKNLRGLMVMISILVMGIGERQLDSA